MQKRVLKLAILSTIISCFMVSLSYAQAFFGGTTTTGSPTGTSTTNKVMSPDEFKSMVNSLGQENQANLAQQVKQQISQAPSQPTTTPPNTVTPDTTTTSSASSSATPPTGQISAPPSSTRTTPTTTSTAPMQPITTTTTQPPVYTGFGGNDTKKTSPATSTDNNSDGFKINY